MHPEFSFVQTWALYTAESRFNPANALKNTAWEKCEAHRLPLLLRTGGGWLTLLWGELRQLLLLQRVKDERTSGDLKMWQKDTTHTKNTKTKRETQGVRIKDGLEGSQAEGGKNAHGDKSRGNWRVNNTIKQNKVMRPLPLSEYQI